MVEKKVLTKFFLNGTSFKVEMVLHSDNLYQIRLQLRLENTVSFLIDDTSIELQSENEIPLSSIYTNNQICLFQQIEKEETIQFIKNHQLYATKNAKRSNTLAQVRALISLTDQDVFLMEDVPIDKNDESQIMISDITNGNTIFIKGEELPPERVEPNKNEDVKQNEQSNNQNEKREATASQTPKKQKLYKFKVDNSRLIGPCRFDPSSNLKMVREELELDNYTFFMAEGEKISQFTFEAKLTLEDIVENNNEIKLTEKVVQWLDPQSTPAYNQPIVDSKLHQKLTQLYKMDIYKYPKVQLTDIERHTAKVMMVVGQTGSGKTTLLNALINFHMGITLNDPFRYVLIVEDTGKNQSHSQTSQVLEYHVKAHNDNPPLIIVDSPGFGDTRGIDFDEQIVAMIKSFFETQIDCIHAVCFVAQSSNARLTASQKYIFTEVLKLFGRDVAENFVCMITFCDGHTPPILEGLTISESPFFDVRYFIRDPWFLKFNNSAIYEKVVEDPKQNMFTQMFWDICMDSFEQFYLKKLKLLPQKSLTLTKEVLKARQQLEVQIVSLQAKNDFLLQVTNNLREQIENIKNNKNLIDANKNFTIEIDRPIIEKIDLPQGTFVTNCKKCNHTCHYPCQIAEDSKKDQCAAMQDGHCKICQGKCHWQEHVNMSFYFKTTMIKEKGRADKIYEAYIDATKKKSSSEQIIEGLKKAQIYCELECVGIQSEIIHCVNLLNQKALKAGVLDSSDQYIDEIIQNEKQEQKYGWQQRVESLNKVKQRHKLVLQTYKGPKNDLQKIKEFIKKEQTQKSQGVFKALINIFN